MEVMKFEKRLLLIVFFMPILIGLVLLFLSIGHDQVYDAGTFIECAKEIAENGWENYGMIKEPGYPILLSLPFRFLNDWTAVIVSRIVNIVLVALSAVIFTIILKEIKPALSGIKLMGYGIIFGCSPQLITFSSLRLYSEPLQVFLMSIILLFFIRGMKENEILKEKIRLFYWVLAGLASSWLIMTKAFFILFPLWMGVSGVWILLFFRKSKTILFQQGNTQVVQKTAPASLIRTISFKKLYKSITIFLICSYVWPFLWSLRNYYKYDLFMICVRGATTLLSHTYLVELETQDSFKWAVYQLSANLGKKMYPDKEKRMMKQTGDAYHKAEVFASYGDKQYAHSELSAVKECLRLIKEHPFKYILFTSLNSLNHVFFEGVYPDIYPLNKSRAVKYIYLLNALLLHFIYSLFIWLIIVSGIIVYFRRLTLGNIKRINLDYVYIVLPLVYFIMIAYHFHTEIRYLHPLYINIYLMFAISLNFLYGRARCRLKGK